MKQLPMIKSTTILKFFSILAAGFMLTACSTNLPAPLPAAAATATDTTGNTGTPVVPPTHADYVIQPGDILEVSVWKEKDLQRELRVRPDGGINFPLVGDMDASGRTLEQFRKELTARLNKYVPDPVVNIAIKESAGNKIYVVGKVLRPGDFVAVRNMDVMQALSVAGGPTAYASVNKIKILRRDEKGELKAFSFKFSRVEKGEDLEQNIILQGGDIVVVP